MPQLVRGCQWGMCSVSWPDVAVVPGCRMALRIASGVVSRYGVAASPGFFFGFFVLRVCCDALDSALAVAARHRRRSLLHQLPAGRRGSLPGAFVPVRLPPDDRLALRPRLVRCDCCPWCRPVWERGGRARRPPSCPGRRREYSHHHLAGPHPISSCRLTTSASRGGGSVRYSRTTRHRPRGRPALLSLAPRCGLA